MSGKWDDPAVPHRGWQFVDMADLEEPCFECEMCETQIISYQHELWHPGYGTLLVGCVCAGHMMGDLAGARAREADFKKHMSRRSRWLTRAWRTSRKGNDYLNTRDGFHVVVFPCGARWTGRFEDKGTGICRASRPSYATKDDAKLAVFDAIERYKDT
jgi:hypothetical protein